MFEHEDSKIGTSNIGHSYGRCLKSAKVPQTLAANLWMGIADKYVWLYTPQNPCGNILGFKDLPCQWSLSLYPTRRSLEDTLKKLFKYQNLYFCTLNPFNHSIWLAHTLKNSFKKHLISKHHVMKIIFEFSLVKNGTLILDKKSWFC